MKVEYLVCNCCGEKIHGDGLTVEYEGPVAFGELTEWHFHDWKCLAVYSDCKTKGYDMK